MGFSDALVSRLDGRPHRLGSRDRPRRAQRARPAASWSSSIRSPTPASTTGLWSGSAWSGEATLQAASATPLQGAFAVAELADGCTVGLAWTEKAASPFDVRFQAVSVPCGGMRVKSGTYTGTGLARSITGVGFQPDVVIVDGVNGGAANAVIRTSTMANPDSKELDQPDGARRRPDHVPERGRLQPGHQRRTSQQTAKTLLLGRVQGGAGRAEGRHLRRRGRGPGRHGHRFQPGLRHRDVAERRPDDAAISALMPPGFCLNFAGAAYSNAILDTLPDGWSVGTNSGVPRRRRRDVPLHCLEHVTGPRSPSADMRATRPTAATSREPRLPAGVRDHRSARARGGQRDGRRHGQRPGPRDATSGVNTDSADAVQQQHGRDPHDIQAPEEDGLPGRRHTAVSTATGPATCRCRSPT